MFNTTSDREKQIVDLARYSSTMEELIALAEGIDDKWWFAFDLPDEKQDMMGLKLKRIIEAYKANTSDIDLEFERIEREKDASI